MDAIGLTGRIVALEPRVNTAMLLVNTIGRFHSRGQHLCKYFGTKEIFYLRKGFNSHRAVLEHQRGRRFIVLGHQYGCHDVNCKTT